MVYSGHKLGSDSASFIIEAFLDYSCPFSKRAYERLVKEVVPFYSETKPDHVQLVFRHQVQPWHPQSTYLHEAALAVAKLDASQFYNFSSALFSTQESFFDSNVWNKTRPAIYEELATIAESFSIDRSKFLELLQLQAEGNAGNAIGVDLKYFIKYSRQNSIHVSPTIIINGLVDNQVSSSWSLDQWKERLSQ